MRVGATLWCGAHASHFCGFSCCGARALGVWASVVVARGLSSCGSQALGAWASVAVAHGLSCSEHVGSSQTRARTRVPCIGRRILNHCATREAQDDIYFKGQSGEVCEVNCEFINEFSQDVWFYLKHSWEVPQVLKIYGTVLSQFTIL